MNSKDHKLRSGFALVEVMMATVIMGFALTSLIVSQTSIARKIAQSHGIMVRLAPIKNMFVNPNNLQAKMNKEAVSDTIPDPETQLSITFDPAGELVDADELYIEKSTGTWEGVFGQDFVLPMSMVAFVPEQEKKK